MGLLHDPLEKVERILMMIESKFLWVLQELNAQHKKMLKFYFVDQPVVTWLISLAGAGQPG